MQKFDFDNMKDGDEVVIRGIKYVLHIGGDEKSCEGCGFISMGCMDMPCGGGVWKEATDDASELEKLLVLGDTHTYIIAGHCTCGEPYALIKGSNHTCGERGIGYFRCTKCGGWLEKTFKADKEQNK